MTFLKRIKNKKRFMFYGTLREKKREKKEKYKVYL